MTALRIGDAAVTRCDITFPRRGVWCADVDLDTETAPTGRVSVVVDGGPTWSGTVVSGGVSHGLWSGRIVGGAGGLRNVLDARAYRNATLADVVADVLTDAAEAIAATAGDLGAAAALWHRPRGTGAAALGSVADAAGYGWRVLADGGVWLGAETWPALTLADVSLLEVDHLCGIYVLGGDTLAVVPGVTLTLADESAQASVRVGDVEHAVLPDGYTTRVWAVLS